MEMYQKKIMSAKRHVEWTRLILLLLWMAENRPS